MRAVQLGDAGTDRQVETDGTIPQLTLTSFGEDGAGCVYAPSVGGTVYRLESTTPSRWAKRCQGNPA
jgi:hypothetical protein